VKGVGCLQVGIGFECRRGEFLATAGGMVRGGGGGLGVGSIGCAGSCRCVRGAG
jgi:hypothetical protein